MPSSLQRSRPGALASSARQRRTPFVQPRLVSVVVAGLFWASSTEAVTGAVGASDPGRRLSSREPTPAESAEWSRQMALLQRERAEFEDLERNITRRGRALDAPSGRRRIGVCVVGQAARLELKSKVMYLFGPLAQQYDVTAVFALSGGDHAAFVNAESAGAPAAARHWTSADVAREVDKALGRRKARRARHEVVVDMSEGGLDQGAWQFTAPYLRRAYVDMGSKFADNVHLRDRRTVSHVQQWRAMWRCYAHFLDVEARTGQRHVGFVKVRDDTLVLKPWTELGSVDFFKGTAVFKDCLDWGGLNDKVAVLDRAHGKDYFLEPLWYYYFKWEELIDGLEAPPTAGANASMLEGEDDDDAEEDGVADGAARDTPRAVLGNTSFPPDGFMSSEVPLRRGRALRGRQTGAAATGARSAPGLLPNPETYLKRVLAVRGVSLRTESPDAMPVVTSRVTKRGYACVPFTYRKVGTRGTCLPKDCDLRLHVVRTQRCRLNAPQAPGTLDIARYIRDKCTELAAKKLAASNLRARERRTAKKRRERARRQGLPPGSRPLTFAEIVRARKAKRAARAARHQLRVLRQPTNASVGVRATSPVATSSSSSSSPQNAGSVAVATGLSLVGI